MPQIDKVTFLTIIYWVFVSYFFLYLDFVVTYLYKFLTYLKFKYVRLCWAYRKVQINLLRARFFLYLASQNLVLLSLSDSSEKSNILDMFSKENIIEFVNVWPLEQWISSLIGLVVLYWLTGRLYNKWLAPYGGWLSGKARILLILSDLGINGLVGLYSLKFLKNTAFGSFMMKCPIAISPAIFMIELIIVFSIQSYRWYKRRKKEKLV